MHAYIHHSYPCGMHVLRNVTAILVYKGLFCKTGVQGPSLLCLFLVGILCYIRGGFPCVEILDSNTPSRGLSWFGWLQVLTGSCRPSDWHSVSNLITKDLLIPVLSLCNGTAAPWEPCPTLRQLRSASHMSSVSRLPLDVSSDTQVLKPDLHVLVLAQWLWTVLLELEPKPKAVRADKEEDRQGADNPALSCHCSGVCVTLRLVPVEI